MHNKINEDLLEVIAKAYDDAVAKGNSHTKDVLDVVLKNFYDHQKNKYALASLLHNIERQVESSKTEDKLTAAVLSNFADVIRREAMPVPPSSPVTPHGKNEHGSFYQRSHSAPAADSEHHGKHKHQGPKTPR